MPSSFAHHYQPLSTTDEHELPRATNTDILQRSASCRRSVATACGLPAFNAFYCTERMRMLALVTVCVGLSGSFAFASCWWLGAAAWTSGWPPWAEEDAGSACPATLPYPTAHPAFRSLLLVHPSSFVPSLHPTSPAHCQQPARSYPLPPLPDSVVSSLEALGYAEDPLPECSLLSPNLTLNLLHYARYIQQPHLHADCASFASSGQCIAGGRPLRPQWLVFYVDAQVAGGYADRLKGLLSALLLAIVTQRAFAIDNTRPLPWSDFWQPNVLPWIAWADMDPQLVRPSLETGRLLQADYMSDELKQAADADLIRLWHGKSIVRMRGNLQTFTATFDNKYLRQHAWRFGFERSRAGDLDWYEGCFLQFMQRPTRLLADFINPLLQQVGRPLLSTGRSVVAAHQSLAFYASPLAAPAPRPLYCAQLRLGNGSVTGLNDSERFLSTVQLPSIMRALAARIAAHSNNSSYSLFITSDSDDYQALVPRFFPSPPAHVVRIEGAPFHVDKTAHLAGDDTRLQSSYLLTIAAFHLLGECDLAFISRSGFGTLSQYRTRQLKKLRRQRQQNAHNVSDYADIFIINNEDAALHSFRHVRGSNGREMDWELQEMAKELPICPDDR